MPSRMTGVFRVATEYPHAGLMIIPAEDSPVATTCPDAMPEVTVDTVSIFVTRCRHVYLLQMIVTVLMTVIELLHAGRISMVATGSIVVSILLLHMLPGTVFKTGRAVPRKTLTVQTNLEI